MFAAFLFIVVLSIQRAISECENGCSGHGSCTVFDMCVCHRNWIGNDCSKRVCEFGLSFVDTPKGDLDSSDVVEGTDEIVVVNSPMYPYGTTEKFPLMEDSNYNQLSNSAHYYAECSNAGICDRDTGICDCFDGFAGAGCQRMQCPGYPKECSGHGVCQNLRQIARKDSGSEYRLWNKAVSRGCICDKGYYGGDCSLRRCKSAVDPLYLDDISTIQYPMYFFAVLTDGNYSDISDGLGGAGLFRIKLHDTHGHAWYSNAIQSGADCEEVLEAVEGIPQAVIPAGTIKCFRVAVHGRNPLGDPNHFSIRYPSLYRYYLSGDKIYTSHSRPVSESAGFGYSYAANKTDDPLLSGDVYLLQFYGNPGDFAQPEIDAHAGDGSRPTLASHPNGNLIAASWTNGQQGSSTDHFADHCPDLQVKVATAADGQTYLWGSFVPRVLLRCVGAADYDDDNDLGVTGGDYGSIHNPHLVRLVRSSTDYRDGGFLVAFYFDPLADIFEQQEGVTKPPGDTSRLGAFKLLHPFSSLDRSRDALFDVYTTKGTLSLVGGNRSEAVFEFASNRVFTTNVTRDFDGLSYDGVVSCEAMGVGAGGSPRSKQHCLDKGDLFLLLDPHTCANNAPYMNMYRALSIVAVDDDALPTIGSVFPNATLSRHNVTSRYHKHVITTDVNTNWAQNAPGNTGTFHVYKFTPHVNSTYHVVAECANRGICDTFEGICECFPGYSGDACAQQDSMAF